MFRVIALVLLLPAALGPAYARGVPMEEDGLVNLESPAAVGRHKVRFDFQHLWTQGKVLVNERMPIAELSLRGGLTRRLQLRVTGLFNNSEVKISDSNYAIKKFSEYEWEAHYQILDQFAGSPVSLAAAADYARWNFYTAVNTVSFNFDGRVYGGKLLAHKDFSRLGEYLGFKWVHTEHIQPNRSYVVSALSIGQRIKLLVKPKLNIDLVGEWSPILHESKETGTEPRDAWGAGLQFKFYNPHTVTFLVSNTSSATMADAVFGSAERAYGFRWSYRF